MKFLIVFCHSFYLRASFIIKKPILAAILIRERNELFFFYINDVLGESHRCHSLRMIYELRYTRIYVALPTVNGTLDHSQFATIHKLSRR